MTNTRRKIVAVDDNLTNLAALKNILKPLYEVYTVSSAAKMFELLTKIEPDLILLDVEMPDLNGYEAAKFLKNNWDHRNIPIIFVTALDDTESEMEGLRLGAVDYIYKPYAAPLLLKRIETHLSLEEHKKELQALNDSMQKKLVAKISQVLELQNAVIRIVADLVEFRDGDTGGHTSRTERYLQNLVNKLMELDIYSADTSSWDMDSLLTSSQLHDVGKIAIPDAILKKPAKLTEEEFAIMKTHTQIGVNAISRMETQTSDRSFFEYAKIFAGAHHEKWDGSGYPKGLKGTDIPLEGRIMAIADVYDALVSERHYKAAMPPEKAVEIIENGRGTHFDPQLIDIFRIIADKFAEISKITTDEVHLGDPFLANSPF